MNKHGMQAIQPVLKEFTQFDGKQVVTPHLDPITLSPKERREARRAINLIQENRDGILKVRICADGHSQLPYISK